MEEIRQKYSSLKSRELDNPESIRTPGRTWTKYPEVSEESIEDTEPEIESEGEVEVATGEKAVERAGEKIFELVQADEDKLTALHARRINSLVYIRAEGRSEVNIVHGASGGLSSHVIVETEKSAELKLTEFFEGEASFVSSLTEIHAGKNSRVEYGSVQAIETNLNYTRKKADLDDHASIEWLNGTFEGELVRTRIETELEGDGSEADILATWYPTEEQHFDTSLHVRHKGEGTRCNMDSRAVVDDQARSVYEGLQKVEQTAEDTSSFQDEEVLSLSDKAEVDASPKLMIENPDVEASHAASTGSIEEQKNHYIETRGLGEERARRLIVKGWFEPVLQQVELSGLKDEIRENVEEKLE